MNEQMNPAIQQAKKQLEEFYAKHPEIAALNAVDGFNPLDFVRYTENEKGEVRANMDVKHRKLWFHMKYPEGRIEKRVISIDGQQAVFEGRVYASKTDDDDDFLANAFASKSYDVDDAVFGKKYVELAELAALGRALADAGFTIQWGDFSDEEYDPFVADGGIEVNTKTGEIISAPDEVPTDNKKEQPTKTASAPPAKPVITEGMTFEEIMSVMDLDTAKKVVITEGFPSYRGKTLGWLAVEKPGSLKYFIDNAKSDLTRAAASYLFERSVPKAG